MVSFRFLFLRHTFITFAPKPVPHHIIRSSAHRKLQQTRNNKHRGIQSFCVSSTADGLVRLLALLQQFAFSGIWPIRAARFDLSSLPEYSALQMQVIVQRSDTHTQTCSCRFSGVNVYVFLLSFKFLHRFFCFRTHCAQSAAFFIIKQRVHGLRNLGV